MKSLTPVAPREYVDFISSRCRFSITGLLRQLTYLCTLLRTLSSSESSQPRGGRYAQDYRNPATGRYALLGTGENLPAQTAIPVGIHGVDTISGSAGAPPDRTFFLRAVPATIAGVSTAMVVGYTGYMAGMACGRSCGAYTFNVLLAATALGLVTGVALLDVHPVQHAIFGTIPIGSVMFLRRC